MIQIDLKELDDVIGAFGRAVTQTEIQLPMRLEAENKVRDFLITLRERVAAANKP